MSTAKADDRQDRKEKKTRQRKARKQAAQPATKPLRTPKAKKTAGGSTPGEEGLKGRKGATGNESARGESKAAQVTALLKRPEGATIEQMMKATGWQAHSVRGFLSGALRKKQGLVIDSAKREDGQRVYTIAS